MKDLLPFLMEHPIISALTLIILCSMALTFVFRLWNRFMRHMNIRNAGWPPAHCDADGDFKPTVNP